MPAPLLTALCLVLLQGQQIKTDFLPSRDLPNFENPGDYINKVGTRGMCNGIDELAVAYLEVRKKNPNALPLNEIVGIIKKYHGDDYLRKTMATATDMSFSSGAITGYFRKNPNDFVSDAVARMQATGQPQSIALQQPGGAFHRVTVYGATQTPSGWTLNISDSNHYERAKADQVTLAVDAKTGALTTSIGGQTKESWLQGGIVPKPAVPPEQYVEMIDRAILGKKLDVPLVERNALPKEAIQTTKDPKTGGVLLRFDPDLFTGSIDEAKLADLNKRLGAFLESDSGGAAILSLNPTVKHLTMIPLADLKPEGTLGGLTRIEGFVAKPDGSLFLAGVKEPGEPAIPSEWLVVALQSAYVKGLSPYISLDPDPQTFSGPQKVRIGDIPSELRSSSFIKTMLDADYLMKKVNLGKEKPKIDAFRCWTDRLGEASSTGQVRMWFTPYSMPAADAFITRKDGSIAALFENQIAVLSESEKSSLEGGVSGGAGDKVALDSARDFTYHFDAMCRQYPEFRRLRAVFEVTKLAACWRALNINAAGLGRWLSAPVPKVSIPDSYPGIGPDLTKDGKYVVSGGAVARARFKAASVVETDRLTPMIDGASSLEVTVELPATLPIGEATKAGFEAQSFLAAAESCLRSGQLDAALANVESALNLDPSDDDALIVKATALGVSRRYPEALAILDKLLPKNPERGALRATFRAANGDVSGALADASKAESEYPDSEAILAACIAARIIAVDADGASQTLSRLRRLSPAYPSIGTMDLQIDLMKFLGPEKAKERVALQTQIPISISLAMLSSGGLATYKDALQQIESGAVQVPAGLYIAERLRLAMASSLLMHGGSPEDLALVVSGTDRMVTDHPDWPSAYFAKFCTLIAKAAPAEEVMPAYRKFSEMEASSDPLMPEIRLMTRLQRLAPFLAVLSASDRGVQSEVRHALATSAAGLTEGQPGHEFLAAEAANPELDLVSLQVLISDGVVLSPGDNKVAIIGKLASTVDSIPASDPAFVPALGYCAASMQVVHSSSAAYGKIVGRGVALTKEGAPSRLFIPLAAKSCATIWLESAVYTTRPLMNPNSPAIKTLEPLIDKMDRLSKPESKGDSLASVGETITAMSKALSGFVGGLRSAVGQSLASRRSQGGDLAGDAIELCIAEVQASLNMGERGEMEKLAAQHPGIEKTASFLTLKATMLDATKGVFTTESEDAVWQRLLRGIKTRYDGVRVQELLTALSQMNSGRATTLNRYMAACKAKTEFGTSLSSSN